MLMLIKRSDKVLFTIRLGLSVTSHFIPPIANSVFTCNELAYMSSEFLYYNEAACARQGALKYLLISLRQKPAYTVAPRESTVQLGTWDKNIFATS
jgi:hypothetical protein